VNRYTASFTIADTPACKKKIAAWAAQHTVACFLDNHQYATQWHYTDCLAAAGAYQSFSATSTDALRIFLNREKDWYFGHVSYDLKNTLHHLDSRLPDYIGFPDLYFFQPETVVQLRGNELLIACAKDDPASIWTAIQQTVPEKKSNVQAVRLQSRISRDTYLETVKAIQQHIHRGDCYELNFCQEFFATGVPFAPLAAFERLNEISPNPFSCFYRLHDHYLVCASPERFFSKQGDTLLSQPIKGTYPRVTGDPGKERQAKQSLLNDPKERTENVMIVDLVRNDLSQVCREGSVQVDELFGVYTFPQVYQLISTISGRLRPGIGLPEILLAMFPMGSMTGAPKKRVMQLIEQYEYTRRGLFSGSVGYIQPDGDMDFNVVIRSLQYNAATQYLNYLVGGGITFYSEPEKEYAECLLKAEAMRRVLEG
jgi:para-aminobenzoate synthetase component 1